MKKKSRVEIERMVEAKAKGKEPKKLVATDDTQSGAAEVDDRTSKIRVQRIE